MHVETPYYAAVNDVHVFFSCIIDRTDLLEEHMDAGLLATITITQAC
jgi:hypothetical protein